LEILLLVLFMMFVRSSCLLPKRCLWAHIYVHIGDGSDGPARSMEKSTDQAWYDPKYFSAGTARLDISGRIWDEVVADGRA
jgi:hypothetical protein